MHTYIHIHRSLHCLFEAWCGYVCAYTYTCRYTYIHAGTDDERAPNYHIHVSSFCNTKTTCCMYVYMYTCFFFRIIYIYIYIYTLRDMHEYIHICMHGHIKWMHNMHITCMPKSSLSNYCTCIHMYTHSYMQTYIHTYKCAHACIHACILHGRFRYLLHLSCIYTIHIHTWYYMHAYVCVCIYIYIYIHTIHIIT
jgi:hypothetical protein